MRSRPLRRVLPPALLALAVGVPAAATLAGCRAAPATSRMSVEDFEEVAAQFAKSFGASPVLANRGPRSEPMVVAFQKVLNLSGDILTPGEQWAAINRVRSARPLERMWDEKQVAFVLSADQARRQVASGIEETRQGSGFAGERRPTHVVTATLQGTRRAQAGERTDMYVWHFEMLELRTNQLVWSGECLIKRQAFGSLRD